MKTHIYNRLQGAHRLLYAFIFLFIFSCDSFTEVDTPQSELIGKTVFEDVGTTKAALADSYARLREGGVNSGTQFAGTPLLANYSDDLDFFGTNANIEQFNKHTMIPANPVLATLWNTGYSQIYAVNALIEDVQGSAAITGEDRDRILGEALFIRAFIHFYYVNMFGSIPYVTTTDYNVNKVIAKLPEALVYQKIIADLIQAESLIPESYPSEERVRANKAAVEAMLARVYLYTGDYAHAKAYADTVINSGTYSVEPDLSLAFLKESPAIIFAFHGGLAGQNTKDAKTYIFTSGPPIRSALSQNLYDAFEPGDLRKTAWLKNVTNASSTWHMANKYKKISMTDPAQEYTIVLRIEEQYLIRSECRAILGDITGAQEDLNITRNRAGLPNTTADTQSALIDAIINERRFEFFTEQGHRWFDLKRTGKAAAVLSAIKPDWKVTDLLFPIPETELLLNPKLLPQNPGY
jgi:hypothetical protein